MNEVELMLFGVTRVLSVFHAVATRTADPSRMMMKLPTVTYPLVCRSFFRSGTKAIVSSSTRDNYVNPKRSMFSQQTFRGDAKYSRNLVEMNEQALEYRLKVGYKIFKEELKNWLREKSTEFPKACDIPVYQDRELWKFWDFREPETLKQFVPTFDALWEEGYSNASLTKSSTGCGLFSGFLDTETLPADRTIQQAGWAALNSPQGHGPFFRERRYDWSAFTHLCLRVRGDGRTYRLTLACPGVVDVLWFQGFSYNLYTHGGPYWQEVRIPFSRFFLQKMGALDDIQDEPRLTEILYLTISLTERVSGPFALEIDYIGLSRHYDHNEKCAYEGYAIKEAARALH